MRKTAVITGAASGIGLATAARFAESGHKIVAIDISDNVPELAKDHIVDKWRWEYIQADVSKDEEINVIGPVDILVCSHGVSAIGRSWDQVMDINAKGVYNVVEKIVPHMVGKLMPRPDPTIVLVASMTGPFVGNKDMFLGTYAASKGAVVGYMRQLAVELAPYGIRVNAVCPGPVATPMTDALKERDPEFYEEFFGRCLLEGYTMPEDVGHAIEFLANNRRMTGQTLVIDGGYTAW